MTCRRSPSRIIPSMPTRGMRTSLSTITTTTGMRTSMSIIMTMNIITTITIIMVTVSAAMIMTRMKFL